MYEVVNGKIEFIPSLEALPADSFSYSFADSYGVLSVSESDVDGYWQSPAAFFEYPSSDILSVSSGDTQSSGKDNTVSGGDSGILSSVSPETSVSGSDLSSLPLDLLPHIRSLNDSFIELSSVQASSNQIEIVKGILNSYSSGYYYLVVNSSTDMNLYFGKSLSGNVIEDCILFHIYNYWNGSNNQYFIDRSSIGNYTVSLSNSLVYTNVQSGYPNIAPDSYPVGTSLFSRGIDLGIVISSLLLFLILLFFSWRRPRL